MLGRLATSFVLIALAACGGSQATVSSDASIDASDDASDASVDTAPADAAIDTATGDAPHCSGDLSNIGAGDFHVSFTITTKQAGIVSVVNQRAICMHGVFWDVHLYAGVIAIETDDRTHYTAFNSTRAVNDGKPHAVVVARIGGVITVTVDGAPVGSSPSTSAFTTLAGVQVGANICDGVDGWQSLIGTVEDLCVDAR